MKLTKTDMAVVIVQALMHGMLQGKQPERDNPEVLRLAKRKKSDLELLHKQAVNILLSNEWLREHAA